MPNEEAPICSKCGKTSDGKQPFIDLDGKKFCCDVCCGENDEQKEEKKKPAICEFC